MKKSAVIPSFLIIIGCSLLASFLIAQQQELSQQPVVAKASASHKPRLFENIQHAYTPKITVAAIGDILIHSPLYRDAFNGANYDFNPMFEQVKPLLQNPDILTANQESLLGGVELGLSGYPKFNSPHQVADALKENGVDIVSTANNHTLDRGEKGIRSETAYFNSIGLPYVGSFTDAADQKTLRIIEKNGIRLAFLSYTYGTNGISVPKGKDYLVNVINRERMAQEIDRAKAEADVVIMSIHWGIEYQRNPTNQQKELANFLANKGVDIIFGSHSHVLQPMEWIQRDDGRKTFVVYSLGNFLSAQTGQYKDIGGIASVDIALDKSAAATMVELTNPVFYPTYVTKVNNHYRVVSLEAATTIGLPNAVAKNNEIQEHMVQWLR
ncbi:CapA family protein [Neobacillus niacini]|uniref:CapA family protein n=1 Tax=Neobacillus niacini TaxID=86668 RepID=UPI0021CB51DD|nr:CapA family protein [Neobacillus niacini]MCM3764641.1 CapA family protein [Neobacillus niacini]